MPKNAATDAALLEALLAALRDRSPASSSADLALRANVMMAIGEGIAGLMVHAEPEERRALVAEMTRAAYGYLATFEEERTSGA